MSLNKYGNFEFISIHAGDHGGPPDLVAEQVETIQRPGYPGTAIIELGRKGKPFQMRSVVDCPSFPAALAIGRAYKEVQGHGPLGLIWGGCNFLAEFDNVYVPIEVSIVKIRRTSCAVGGLYPPSLAIIECLWTLQPLELPNTTPAPTP